MAPKIGRLLLPSIESISLKIKAEIVHLFSHLEKKKRFPFCSRGCLSHSLSWIGKEMRVVSGRREVMEGTQASRGEEGSISFRREKTLQMPTEKVKKAARKSHGIFLSHSPVLAMLSAMEEGSHGSERRSGYMMHLLLSACLLTTFSHGEYSAAGETLPHSSPISALWETFFQDALFVNMEDNFPLVYDEKVTGINWRNEVRI